MYRAKLQVRKVMISAKIVRFVIIWVVGIVLNMLHKLP